MLKKKQALCQKNTDIVLLFELMGKNFYTCYLCVILYTFSLLNCMESSTPVYEISTIEAGHNMAIIFTLSLRQFFFAHTEHSQEHERLFLISFESPSALLMGSGILYLPVQLNTIVMAPCMSIICPGDTKTGLTFSLVLTVAPTVFSLYRSCEKLPFVNAGSAYSPINLDLAHPIAGMLRSIPRCVANPMPAGWAIP